MIARALPILGMWGLLTACGQNYYTSEDFTKVKKIDTHTHLNARNKALDDLAREDNFTLLNVCVDVPGYPSLEVQEELALWHVSESPGITEYLSAFSLHGLDSPGWSMRTIRRLSQSFDRGALGIKLWKNIGMQYRNADSSFIMVDDPRLDSVIRYVISRNKTVMAHIGEPKNCWLPLQEMTVNNDRNYFRNHPEYHMYLHPEYPSYDDQIMARDRFLAKHPDIRFVGAHLGSLEWEVDVLAKHLDRFPNVAVDLAARIPHLQHQTISDREKVRTFCIQYQDRLIYASDSGIDADSDPEETRRYVHQSWFDDWRYIATDEKLIADEVNGEFTGLKLPREVVDKIFRENAVNWFRINANDKR